MTAEEASNRDLLRKIVDDLLTKKRINRPKFFQALEIAHKIARDCSEQCDRAQQENIALHQRNNQLTGLIFSQANAITGSSKEYHA